MGQEPLTGAIVHDVVGLDRQGDVASAVVLERAASPFRMNANENAVVAIEVPKETLSFRNEAAVGDDKGSRPRILLRNLLEQERSEDVFPMSGFQIPFTHSDVSPPRSETQEDLIGFILALLEGVMRQVRPSIECVSSHF